jgi:hypothetical protein
VTDVNVRFLRYFDYHFIAYNITIRFLKTCKFYIGFGEMRCDSLVCSPKLMRFLIKLQ